MKGAVGPLVLMVGALVGLFLLGKSAKASAPSIPPLVMVARALLRVEGSPMSNPKDADAVSEVVTEEVRNASLRELGDAPRSLDEQRRDQEMVMSAYSRLVASGINVVRNI